MGLRDIGLPQDQLPQCWSDDVRMNALFAPFRLKSVQPESWAMKMKFWSDVARQWCKYKHDPIISASDMKFAFQRKGRTSACIDIVIEEMYRNGDLCPLSKYQQILHNDPEGWMLWGTKLAFKPAALAITAVTSLLPARQSIDKDGLPKSTIDATQRFVLESAVKEQATSLLENYPPGMECIGTIEYHMKNTCHTNREVFELLLGYLVSQGAAIKRGDVVKLAEPNKKVGAITEMDTALVKLRSAEQKLSDDMCRLNKEIEIIYNDVRAALKVKNRLAAKNHLRRKLPVQQRLERCEMALLNVRQLVEQVKDVDVNAAVVDTYRTSARAMKSTMKDGGLEEDSVHDVMDDLKEVMESYGEVENALSGAIGDVDLDELETELRELLVAPGSGGPGGSREDAESSQPAPATPKRHTERDFVFDGEERMLADLNRLGLDESRSAAATRPRQEEQPKARKSREVDWGRRASDGEELEREYAELRMDERIHPGQELRVDYAQAPRHFAADFQVRDHKSVSGVWLFNSEDSRRADLAASTTYMGASPGKSESPFLTAVGGERRPSSPSKPSSSTPQPSVPDSGADLQDLQRRLNNLRGF